MKIIDKNTDFYDYYQNIYIDNTFTFDRTDSFVLTKDMMCQYLNIAKHWYWRYQNQYFLILQICNTFWLFLITVTKETNDSFKHRKTIIGPEYYVIYLLLILIMMYYINTKKNILLKNQMLIKY